MEIKIPIDLDKVFRSKVGTFALQYWFYSKKKRKVKPKDNWDKIIFFMIDLMGKLSLLYLHFLTYLYYRSLSEEEVRKLADDPSLPH